MSDVHNPATHIREQAKRIKALETALLNIRERCFDDSEWGRYIDRVLGRPNKREPRHET